MLLREICEGFAENASAEIVRNVQPNVAVAQKPASFEL